MENNTTLTDEIRAGNNVSKRVCLDTSIIDFIEIIGRKGNRTKKGVLPFGIYYCLEKIGRHVETLGELKKLAENADGFERLKYGVYFNDGRCLPYTALQSFGKKKLEFLNEILSQYKIEPIPWMSRKYCAWQRKKERGGDWREHLKI